MEAVFVSAGVLTVLVVVAGLLRAFRAPINEVVGHVFPHPSDSGWTKWQHHDAYQNGEVLVWPLYGTVSVRGVTVAEGFRAMRYARAVARIQRELVLAEIEKAG